MAPTTPLVRAAAATVLAGALSLSGLFVASPADAHERHQKAEDTQHVLVQRTADRQLGFAAVDAGNAKGDQRFCDDHPVDDDIVECDIDEIAWTCVNGDTDPTDGGCIGNADKPSVFPD